MLFTDEEWFEIKRGLRRELNIVEEELNITSPENEKIVSLLKASRSRIKGLLDKMPCIPQSVHPTPPTATDGG